MAAENAKTSLPVSPVIERVRHELKRRSVFVERIERITPGMLRLVLSGGDLADFVSLGADDHIKIFVDAGADEPARRDYTPRRYSNSEQTLTLDFALHDAGPATHWALNAKPGDTLQIGGPRGSAVISGEIQNWLLIGDETALPAIGRRIEETGAGIRITSLVAVVDEAEHQLFETKANHTAIWVHRPLGRATSADALIDALKSVEIGPRTFVWIAAEASVTRAVRSYLTEERQFPLSWMKASGYWVMGKADTTESFA